MAIPISYNIRNLTTRKTTTLMTALGIALTVAVLLSVMAMVQGLRTSMEASGNPLHLLVMRKGATAELNSIVTPARFQELKSMPGIAKAPDGTPMASLEVVTVIVLESAENPSGINITLRGLTPVGFGMRDGLKIVEGRMFEAGKREVVVGKGLAGRYPDARMGRKLRFGRGEWEVVGVMDAGRGAANSEVFADLFQLASDQGRPEALSSVLIRATDPVTMRGADQQYPVRRALQQRRCAGKGLLRAADQFRRADTVPGNLCGSHYGGRQQLRRHEYDVRGGNPAIARNRHAPRPWLLPRGNFT